MKTQNKFSQMREEQGHTNPVNGTARHRISIGSIVSRYSLATLICTLMLTLGVGNVCGGVTSGESYSTAGSLPTGWSKNGDYNNNAYVKLVSSDNYILSDEFCQNGFTSIVVNARKFGGPSDAQKVITVEWVETGGSTTVLGTNAGPSGTSLVNCTISVTSAKNTAIGANTKGKIKVSCKGAGSSKGCGVAAVTINYTAGSCGGGSKTLHVWNGTDAFDTEDGGATLPTVPDLCESVFTTLGWCSEETYASRDYPSGKIYSSGDSWPAGKTNLYACYQVGSQPNYYYSTKPNVYTITYNLTNVEKDDVYSYPCTSDIISMPAGSLVTDANLYAYFRPTAGAEWDAVSITMGGSPVDASDFEWTPNKYPDDDYPAELFMEGITGNIVVTVTATACASAVAIAKGTESNATLSFSSASAPTCSSSASDRRVTVSVVPNTCYAAPVAASVTSSGTSCTKISGPTWNAVTSKYDYVYEFAKDATGTTTFSVSLSSKTTYTVSYAAGSTTATGGNAISGSHANDTKTCGTNMTLPGASFTTTGYTQTGWSKTSGGSQYAAVGGSYTDDAAQTFYPVWTANKYTVTWNVNGTDVSTTSNVSHGTTTSTPSAPSVPGECDGAVFVGWTATQNYSGGSAPGNLFNGTTPAITGNITFYAVFAEE